MNAPDAELAAVPCPPAPASFIDQFGCYAETMNQYARWLAGPAIVRGLIGPREGARLWDRHLLNSVALSELLPSGVRLVDVGSGAGLPGLALACVRPDLRVDLVEPLLRRTTFLEEVVADLGVGDRVRVIRGRANDPSVVRIAGRAEYATARAVAGLDKLAEWVHPLLAAGGNLLAVKGDRASDEVAAHRDAINASGMNVEGVVECGGSLVSPPIRVAWLRRL